ncbi:DUF1036 domain-containing protein [Thalassococcus lentus]|uniref:DUF1036 domain-containing protein n=1 Tax=Thalassococcus lentus TaxID=1210524 RepID=A0ABT4XS86_9RHOB|nr:DUF1036 domain-containing protein [Thalassococcus lentus]MDA7424708.1 DUF1036 domain-containing protein [Thalassococcus lentus]
MAIFNTKAGLTLLLALCGTAATAELTICNEGPDRQSLAIGYEALGGVWTSEGWWGIDPGACKTVRSRALDKPDFFYRATTSGGAFDAPFAFCTASEAFTILGDKDCSERGYRRERFAKIDTDGARSYRLVLGANGALLGPRDPEEDIDYSDAPLQAFSTLQRGTLGEPLSQVGLFNGCTIEDGLEFCSFIAEGWRYHAYYGGGSGDEILNELQNWPLNTAVEFSGDLIGYGDITAEVALAMVLEQPGGDAFAAQRMMMQGLWRSQEDPRADMRILGSDVYEFYDGDLVSQQLMQLQSNCEGFEGLGQGFWRTELEQRDPWCLLIGRVSQDSLIFTNPLRGNQLVYARVE